MKIKRHIPSSVFLCRGPSKYLLYVLNQWKKCFSEPVSSPRCRNSNRNNSSQHRKWKLHSKSTESWKRTITKSNRNRPGTRKTILQWNRYKCYRHRSKLNISGYTKCHGFTGNERWRWPFFHWVERICYYFGGHVYCNGLSCIWRDVRLEKIFTVRI